MVATGPYVRLRYAAGYLLALETVIVTAAAFFSLMVAVLIVPWAIVCRLVLRGASDKPLAKVVEALSLFTVAAAHMGAIAVSEGDRDFVLLLCFPVAVAGLLVLVSELFATKDWTR